MINYKFTKKQLYGYSVMNWKLYRSKLYKADKRYCSFCYDCLSRCSKCQIASHICDMSERGYICIYREITTLKQLLFDKIDKIIDQLTIAYNQI